MVGFSFTISSESGLHLKPAEKLSELACRYHARIYLVSQEEQFNAKSVLSVLAAGLKYNDKAELICEGEDEKEALLALQRFIDTEQI